MGIVVGAGPWWCLVVGTHSFEVTAACTGTSKLIGLDSVTTSRQGAAIAKEEISLLLRSSLPATYGRPCRRHDSLIIDGVV